MKRILILFIIHCSLLIPSTRDCLSQSITWQRVYNINIAEAEAYDICEADGNNFYIAGSAGAIQTYMCVIKINQYGDTLWTRNYGGGRIYAVTSSGDGGCVFTGDIGSSFAIKINMNGDTVWTRFYNGKRAYEIKKTIDGGYILCGDKANGFNRDGYVCKIDSLGNSQWEKTYPGGYVVDFQVIDLASDVNGYVITGSKYDTPNGQSLALFLKINNVGDTIWQKTYNIGIDASLRTFAKKTQDTF